LRIAPFPSDEDTLEMATALESWAAMEPERAVEWSARLSDSEARGEMLQRAFGQWARRDMMGAAQWLSDHESDPLADRLTTRLLFGTSLMLDAPTVALHWAQTIDNPERRASVIEVIIRGWAVRDSAAAEAFLISDGSLPAERRDGLRQAIAARREVGIDRS
jgi:hypothetical protein